MSSNADCQSTFPVSGTIALAMLMSTATVVPTTTTTSHTATASSTATTTGAMGGVANMGFTGIGTNIAVLVAVANVVAAARVARAILFHIVIGAFSRGFPAERGKGISAKHQLEYTMWLTSCDACCAASWNVLASVSSVVISFCAWAAIANAIWTNDSCRAHDPDRVHVPAHGHDLYRDPDAISCYDRDSANDYVNVSAACAIACVYGIESAIVSPSWVTSRWAAAWHAV